MIENIHLPTLNAFLNLTCATLLGLGFFFVRRGNIVAHRRCMMSAIAVSALFLTSYLIYHYSAGSTRFTGTGWIRPVYFAILISHTILAVAIVPMVLVTFVRAWANRFDAHKRIARWTWPVWMYVSVTGVVIYLMLYRL